MGGAIYEKRNEDVFTSVDSRCCSTSAVATADFVAVDRPDAVVGAAYADPSRPASFD